MSIFSVYDLYTQDEVEKMLSALPSDWKPGKARTELLTEALKNNEEIQPRDSKIVESLARAHAQRFASNTQVKTDHIIKGVSPPKFNRYQGGGTYRRHTDSPVMAGVRTDLACTTFLTDGYEGGSLNVEDRQGDVHTFKGRVGQTVVYPCGQPHWVDPVTSGERVALVCWAQSYIREKPRRDLLSGMIRSLAKIEPLTHDDELMREVWTELGSTHAELFRMWMQ